MVSLQSIYSGIQNFSILGCSLFALSQGCMNLGLPGRKVGKPHSDQEEVEKIKKLAKEIGIKPEIDVYEIPSGSPYVLGCNFFWSRPAVFLPINSDSLIFSSILTNHTKAHELVHIRQNHYFSDLFFIIGKLAGSYFIKKKTTFWWRVFAASFIGGMFIGDVFCRRKQEREADLIGCEYTDEKGIAQSLRYCADTIAAHKFMYAFISHKGSLFEKIKMYLTITPEGENRFSFGNAPYFVPMHLG